MKGELMVPLNIKSIRDPALEKPIETCWSNANLNEKKCL